MSIFSYNFNLLNTNLANRTLRGYKLSPASVSAHDTYINTDSYIVAVDFVAGVASVAVNGKLYVIINSLTAGADVEIPINSGVSATVVIHAVRLSAGWTITIEVTNGSGESVSKTKTLAGAELNTIRVHAGGGTNPLNNVSSFYQKYVQ